MTASIDKKIVEMAFENSGFEKGVSQSVSSIDKLKQSLQFRDAGKGFADITSAANRVNLGSIAQGVDSLSQRFSAMGIIAMTVLANITNSAFNAAKGIAKALVIDPIKTGLDEYETKLNSVQTILANTQKEGTNLDIVTSALNELNTYADKTIYNFREMTRNIGTFTAAGVKLDTSVSAIKGIANLAAISGSNSQQASTAMYQLSQALSSGTVKLMDWNSVVNAGMGGQVFQDAIKETARLHGVAIDQMIEEEGSFRETLQRGWFTSEILTDTLAKFTGDLNEDQLRTLGYTDEQIAGIIKMGQTANDAATKVKTFTQLFDTLKEAAQSGWAQTWELIIGDFNEAKEFLTQFNDWFGAILGASADARNTLLQGWDDLGGRNKMLEAFSNILNAIVGVLNPIKQGMREIFPPMTAQTLYLLTERLATFTKGLILSGEGIDKVKRIFKGLFAIVDIARMALVAIGESVFGLTKHLAEPAGDLIDFLATIGDYIVGVRDGLKTTDGFRNAIASFADFLAGLGGKIADFFKKITGGLTGFDKVDLSGLKTFMDNLTVEFTPLKTMATLVGKVLTIIGTLVSKIAPVAMKLGSIIATGIGSFLDKISVALENFEPERVFDIINGGLFAGILLAIKKFISEGGGLFGGIGEVLDTVKDSLVAWQTNLKADALLKIALALGILTIAIVALSTIDSNRLATALGAMTAMFIQLGAALVGFQKVSSTTNPLTLNSMALGLIAMAAAMLVMALAVAKLGKLEPDEMVRGLVAMFAVISLSKIATNALSANAPGMISASVALVIFSLAIRSLGEAVEKFGALNTGNLTQGLIAIGVLLTELAAFMKAADLSDMGITKSVGILILAGAINLLALAVTTLANLDEKALTRGLVTIGIIFAQIAAFVALTGAGTGLIVTAGGVLIISGAMLILAEVMTKFANLSWEGIVQGLLAMSAALLIIGAAAYLIPPTLLITAAGLVVMAGALLILAEAMRVMGDMTWDEVARGLTVLGAALVGISSVLLLLGSMPTAILGATALLIASAALLAMAPALKILGSMSLEEIGLGLLALVGAFTVMGLAASILTPVIPSILGLAGAMILLGAGLALIGTGVFLFSAGLATLAVSGAAGGAALVTIITSIVGLVPMLVKTLGRAILALVDVLVEGAPKLLEGIVLLLNILIDGLIDILPKIVTFVDMLLTSLVELIIAKVPDLLDAGYVVVTAFLQGISDNIENIVNIVTDIVLKFVGAVADRLPDIAQAGWDLIISWVDAMKAGIEDNLPRLMESIRELGLAIVAGILTGIKEGAGDTREAIKELGQIVIDTFKEILGINSPSTVFIDLAWEIIQGLARGLKDNVDLAVNEMISLAATLISKVKDRAIDFYNAGRDLVTGLANGIKDYIGTAVTNAQTMAQNVLTGISTIFDEHSPSRKTFESGKNVVLGLADGILRYASTAVGASEKLGDQTLSGFNAIVSKISDTVNSNLDFQPTIAPVMDMSDVLRGGKLIDGLFSDPKALNVSTDAAIASRISANQTTPATEAVEGGQTTANNISLVQNNYSPVALSRYEIYRQTRNQLLQVKGLEGV